MSPTPVKRTPTLPSRIRTSSDTRSSGSHRKKKVLRKELNKRRATQSKLPSPPGTLPSSPLRADVANVITQSQGSPSFRGSFAVRTTFDLPSSASLHALVAPTAQVTHASTEQNQRKQRIASGIQTPTTRISSLPSSPAVPRSVESIGKRMI
jgi:hypothetical protein